MRFTESFIAAAAAAGVAGQEFVFTGANQAGAEFGEKNIPGQLDKDYTWPVSASIDVRPRSCWI
jgi:endoglucanase